MAKTREMPADVERTRSVVVDSSLQWTAALSVGSVIASGLVLLAMSRFMSSTTDGGDMSSQDSALLAVIWNAVLIGFVMAVVTTFILVFTRRVAGAARVLERAIDGMCDDDPTPGSRSGRWVAAAPAAHNPSRRVIPKQPSAPAVASASVCGTDNS